MKPKKLLQDEARERDAAWASLTSKQQLAALDQRLGENAGAEKQRGRLLYDINQDLAKAKKYALAYGAGPATIAAIEKRHEARGPAIISARFSGKGKLKGERGIVLNSKKRTLHLNDTDEEVLIQWDDTKLKGSHGWTKVNRSDLKDLHTSESNTESEASASTESA